MSQPQPVADAGHMGVMGPWIGVCALADLVMSAIAAATRSEGFMEVLMGSAAGQFGVLTVWATLGPERPLERWLKALLGVVLLYGALLVGLAIPRHGPDVQPELCATVLMLPLIFLAAQFPLWILRVITGWEIARGGSHPPPAASRQFSVKHLLGAMTAMAALLGLASLGLSATDARGHGPTSAMWLTVTVACLVAAIWNALITLPCLYLAMAAGDRPTGCLIVAGYTMMISLVVSILLGMNRPIEPPEEVLLAFLALDGTMALVVFVSLYLLGKSGYTLHRPRAAPRAEAAAPAASTPDSPQEPAGTPEAGNPFRQPQRDLPDPETDQGTATRQ